MFKKFLPFIFLPALLISEGVFAQINSFPVDTGSEKSRFSVDLRYTSNYVYMGRADSARTPYLTPSVSYFHKSGFFVHGSLSYLLISDDARIDYYKMSAGYELLLRNLSTGISVSQYFFNAWSYAIPAELGTSLNAYAGYDLATVIVYADAALGFNSASTDIFLGGEVTRTFYAMKNALRFTPAVSFTAGTQQFYNDYQQTRSGRTGTRKGKGGSPSPPPTIDQPMLLEPDAFKPLDIGVRLQLIYRLSDLRLFTISKWTFPLNPSVVIYDQRSYIEDLDSKFAFTAGIQLTLD